jgi:hypothetical protein
MTKALIVLATAAGIGLAATIATDPLLSGGVGGEVDVQSRLLLWSADCKEQGQCGEVAAQLASE